MVWAQKLPKLTNITIKSRYIRVPRQSHGFFSIFAPSPSRAQELHQLPKSNILYGQSGRVRAKEPERLMATPGRVTLGWLGVSSKATQINKYNN